jgi:choline-sulfatase
MTIYGAGPIDGPQPDLVAWSGSIMKLKTIIFIVISLAVVLFSARILLRKKPPRPNVVVVVIDTLRADRLPFYGYPKETAPFLSKLAARGVVFDKAYAASSWTAPATASIFTALYPFQHGVVMGLAAQMRLIKKYPQIKINRIPEDVTTMPEVFRQGGYRTFGFSDNANISKRQGFEQGFDHHLCLTHQGAGVINQHVLDLEKEIRTGGPYFLYLHYDDPHMPYRIPLDESEKTGDRTTDLKAMYDKEISFVDSRLEELYARFDWSRNTLLIVTADHGEEQMEKGFYGHGKTLYNTVVHVPLLFFWPEEKVFAAKRSEVNVSTMDILPTLASLLDLPRVKGLAGEDLMPALKGKIGSAGKRFIYSHLQKRTGTPNESLHKACFNENYKYIFEAPDTHSLFNLKGDPGENRNLYAEEQRTAHKLAANLFAFEKACPRYNADYVEIRLDEKSIEQLRSLGYVH